MLTLVRLPSNNPERKKRKLDDPDVHALVNHEVNCSWVGLYYDKVQTLISMVDPLFVIEVGVAYGYHAKHILKANSGIEYVGVDPFVVGYGVDDPFQRDVADLFESGPQEAMDRLYSAVTATLQHHWPGRSRLIRESSVEASKAYGEDSVPFLFLDGDHTYDSVLKDLRAWWPKISKGGILVGDDFAWGEVASAVSDFCGEISVNCFTVGSPTNEHLTFYLVKP